MIRWILGAGLGLALSVALTPGAVSAQTICGLNVTCEVEDLGDDLFRITYTLKNTSAAGDAIFKWRLENPAIADEWKPISSTAPADWIFTHHVGRIDFDSSNGSGSLHRIYSTSLAACGAPSTLQFSWVLDRNGGPVPDCTAVDGEDFKVHAQPIDPATCANSGISLVCPSVVPVAPSTWTGIKARFGR